MTDSGNEGWFSICFSTSCTKGKQNLPVVRSVWIGHVSFT